MEVLTYACSSSLSRVFWNRAIYARYTACESNRSMCDDTCCDFYGQENTKPDIAHRTGVCHSSPFVGQSPRSAPFRRFWRIFQPASMGHAFVRMFEMEIVQQMGMSGTRLTSNRNQSMWLCDDACCDFFWPREYKTRYSVASINCVISGANPTILESTWFVTKNSITCKRNRTLFSNRPHWFPHIHIVSRYYF